MFKHNFVPFNIKNRTSNYSVPNGGIQKDNPKMSSIGMDYLMDKIKLNEGAIDPLDKYPDSRLERFKKSIVDRFKQPDNLTAKTLPWFNRLIGVKSYKNTLLGLGINNQNPFHRYLLQQVGLNKKGDASIKEMEHFIGAAKSTLGIAMDTPSIVTPISLKPTWAKAYNDALTLYKPDEVIKTCLTQKYTSESRQQALGLNTQELADIEKMGPNAWSLLNLKQQYGDMRAAVLQDRMAKVFADHYYGLELDRTDRLRQNNNISPDKSEMVILKLMPSSNGPSAINDLINRRRVQQASSLPDKSLQQNIQRFLKNMGRQNEPLIPHDSPKNIDQQADQLEQNTAQIEKMANFASLRDGIIHLNEDLFFKNEKQQAEIIRYKYDKNGKNSR